MRKKDVFGALLFFALAGASSYAAVQNAEARAAVLLEQADHAELTEEMLVEAAGLLDHDDVFIRAMAEWTISRKVGYDNRKDVAVWPKDDAPAWYTKWHGLTLDQLIEYDWCRQIIVRDQHQTAAQLREEVKSMATRLKLQVENDIFAESNLTPVNQCIGEITAISAAMEKADKDSSRRLWLKARRLLRRAVFLNRQLDFDSLVFYTRYAPHHKNNVCGVLHNGTYKPGGDITIIKGLDQMTEKRVVINGQLGPGHLHGMDLHFDGNKVVFGYGKQPVWPATKEANWPQRPNANWAKQLREDLGPVSLYEINVDGSHLEQLTKHHIWSDTEPVYCPNDDVAFSSERSAHSPPCDSYINDITDSNIYLYRRETESIRRLTNQRDIDMTPRLLENGNLAYLRWEYQERHFFDIHSVWTIRPDGTNADAYFKQHLLRPMAIREVRSIPGTGKLVGIAAGHHVYSRGPIVTIDPSVGENSADAIRLFTQGPLPLEGNMGMSTKPVEFGGTQDRVGLYRNPYALSEDTILASYGYGSSFTPEFSMSRRNNVESNGLGIYLIDAFGNKELIYRDPIYCSVDVFPLKKRSRPTVIPDMRDGGKNYATCVINDIYDGMNGVQRGEIKYIRICEPLPTPLDRNGRARKYAWGDKYRVSEGVTRWTSVRVIGTVPVEEDGSAHFKVPTVDNGNIYFQALDKDYMEIQRMRSNVSFQPGEVRSCLGCHETRLKRAPPQKKGVAASRLADFPTPPSWGYEAFDFEEIIQPVFDQHCVSCHGNDEPKANIDLSSTKKASEKQGDFNQSFHTIMGKDLLGLDKASLVSCSDRFSDGSVTQPYQFGSHKSKLIAAIRKGNKIEGHKKLNLSDDEWLRLVTWVDLNAPYHSKLINKHPTDGSMARREKWTWPDPWRKGSEVPAFTPTTPTPEKYVGYIVSDAKMKKLVRYDNKGNATWEINSGYCFDLQAFPNGNVLYSDGKVIREINREKTVIWQYDTGKEAYSCQRLPNGNTLIGDCGNSCLTLLDRSGHKVKDIPLQIRNKGHHGIRWARKTEKGTYLVAQSADYEICEYDESGKKLRTVKMPGAVFSVVPVPNGDLIAGGAFGVQIIALDNSVKWSLTKADLPEVNLQYVLGIQQLDNGNLLISNWLKHDKNGVMLFEVTKDKKLVRKLSANKGAGWISTAQLIHERETH